MDFLIIDDDKIFREATCLLIEDEGHYVQTAANAEAALACVREEKFDAALLDLNLGRDNGLTVLPMILKLRPNLPVVMFSAKSTVKTAVQAMHLGAIDFLEKPFERDSLLRALEAGFAQLADRDAKRQREEWAKTQIAGLTEREREVLEGLACGYPNKTIAYDLGISSRTVEVYRANAMAKLEVSNFADALRIAFAAGMGNEKQWRVEHQVGVRRAPE